MTRILQTGICKTNSKFKLWLQSAFYNSSRMGFTLIELIVVIFLISITTTLIIPTVWQTEKDILKTEANRISSILRYIHDEAISKKQVYLFKINFDKKIWGFEGNTISRHFEIKSTPGIKDIMLLSRGEVSFGEVVIRFGPMGTEEPITLHLQNGKTNYTIMFNHLTGRTKILEGYIL